MSVNNTQFIPLTEEFRINKMKRLAGLILFVLLLAVQHAGAQNVVLENTTITTEESYTAQSVTLGPDLTITDTGDLALNAENVYVKSQIAILQGGKLLLVSTEKLPENTMLVNGAFTDDLNGWDFLVMGTGNATYDLANRVFHAQIVNGGFNVWDVSLKQPNLTINNGNTYTVSFKARAAGPRDIQAYVALKTAPYTLYNSNYIFSLTTEWQTYGYTFTMTHPTDTNAWLGFDFGANDMDVYLDNISLVEESSTGIQEEQQSKIVKSFKLFQNYPNPFNPITTIHYEMPKNSHVNLAIFDVIGREVKTLLNRTSQAGTFKISWDGTDNLQFPVAGGIYFCRMEAGDFVKTIKLALVR